MSDNKAGKKNQIKKNGGTMSPEIYAKKANILKALGHPLRLQMLDILRNEKVSVSALCQKLSEEQANISRHLSILRKEELIDYHKEGVSTFYKVKYDCITTLNECLDSIMRSRLEGEIEMLKNL